MADVLPVLHAADIFSLALLARYNGWEWATQVDASMPDEHLVADFDL